MHGFFFFIRSHEYSTICAGQLSAGQGVVVNTSLLLRYLSTYYMQLLY